MCRSGKAKSRLCPRRARSGTVRPIGSSPEVNLSREAATPHRGGVTRRSRGVTHRKALERSDRRLRSRFTMVPTVNRGSAGCRRTSFHVCCWAAPMSTVAGRVSESPLPELTARWIRSCCLRVAGAALRALRRGEPRRGSRTHRRSRRWSGCRGRWPGRGSTGKHPG